MTKGVCVAGGMHGGDACMVGGGACMVGVYKAGEMVTVADSTHPTGMHSCLCCTCKALFTCNICVCVKRQE